MARTSACNTGHLKIITTNALYTRSFVLPLLCSGLEPGEVLHPMSWMAAPPHSKHSSTKDDPAILWRSKPLVQLMHTDTSRHASSLVTRQANPDLCHTSEVR